MSNSEVVRMLENIESFKEHVKQTYSEVAKRAQRSCAERAEQSARRGLCTPCSGSCTQKAL